MTTNNRIIIIIIIIIIHETVLYTVPRNRPVIKRYTHFNDGMKKSLKFLRNETQRKIVRATASRRTVIYTRQTSITRLNSRTRLVFFLIIQLRFRLKYNTRYSIDSAFGLFDYCTRGYERAICTYNVVRLQVLEKNMWQTQF